MSNPCHIAGDPDMYGLGIRIGFYLQWYARIAADWVTPDEVNDMRISNNLFLAAMFLALLIKTFRNIADLQPAEVYIILLFGFGSVVKLVPAVVLRILTWRKPQWDPYRALKVPTSIVTKILFNSLICAVSAFSLWFWITQVPADPEPSCAEYGFLLYKVALKRQWFRAVNIALNAFALGTVSLSLILLLAWRFRHRSSEDEQVEDEQVETISESRKVALQSIFTMTSCVSAGIVVAAVEFSIYWNNIQDVQDVDSAGQTIPLMLGTGAFIRVFYKYFYKEEEKNNDFIFDTSGMLMQSAPPPGLPSLSDRASAQQDEAA